MSERDMSEYVTRGEFHQGLELWAGAIVEKLTAQLTTQLTAQLTAQIGQLRKVLTGEFAAFRVELRADLARDIRANTEALRSDFAAIDDKYKDIPARVSRLEAKVFPPSRKRASTAARRRR